MQHSAERHGAAQWGTAWHGVVQYVVWNGTRRRNTTWCSTAWDGTAGRSTARCSMAQCDTCSPWGPPGCPHRRPRSPVQPLRFSLPTSAPCFSSTRAHSRWPSVVARCSGVRPRGSSCSMSAWWGGLELRGGRAVYDSLPTPSHSRISVRHSRKPGESPHLCGSGGSRGPVARQQLPAAPTAARRGDAGARVPRGSATGGGQCCVSGAAAVSIPGSGEPRWGCLCQARGLAGGQAPGIPPPTHTHTRPRLSPRRRCSQHPMQHCTHRAATTWDVPSAGCPHGCIPRGHWVLGTLRFPLTAPQLPRSLHAAPTLSRRLLLLNCTNEKTLIKVIAPQLGDGCCRLCGVPQLHP